MNVILVAPSNEMNLNSMTMFSHMMENGEIAAYYPKDKPEYLCEIPDRYREWIKSRGGLKEVMYF